MQSGSINGDGRGLQAAQEKWEDTNHLPAITVLFVAGLANPDWLVEIAAITE